jgi:hypothetical protein
MPPAAEETYILTASTKGSIKNSIFPTGFQKDKLIGNVASLWINDWGSTPA